MQCKQQMLWAAAALFMSPVLVEAADPAGSYYEVPLQDRKWDADTDGFISRLNGINRRASDSDQKSESEEDSEARAFDSTLSRYGRGTRKQISGKASANRIERPGAALGGDSRYSR